MSAIDAYLELEALRHGRALRRASVRFAADLDDERLGEPILFGGYAIANEHVGIHAFLLDRLGSDAAVEVCRADELDLAEAAFSSGHPVFVVAFDGRSPEGRHQSLCALARLLNPTFDDERPPRLIVPSRADWALLREALGWELERALRPGSARDAALAAFLCRAQYWIERAPAPGAQSLVVLADVLQQVFAIPSPAGAHPHLGALLSWIGERDRDPAEAVRTAAEAETVPGGARSRPEWDNATLLPALEALNERRRAGEDVAEAWDRAARLLYEHLAHRHVQAHSAISTIFSATGLPAAPSVDDLVVLERRCFADQRRRVAAVLDLLEQAIEDGEGPGDAGAGAPAADAAPGAEDGELVGEPVAAGEVARHARRRLLPTRAWRSRFGEWEATSQALALRALLEDRVERARARARGATLPGTVLDASLCASDPTSAGEWVNARGDTMTRWQRRYRAEVVLAVDDEVPLGRFRRNAEVLVGPGDTSNAQELASGVWSYRATDHATRTVRLVLERHATKSVPFGAGAPRPEQFKVPAGFDECPLDGTRLEVFPIAGTQRLALDAVAAPAGPAPRTHRRAAEPAMSPVRPRRTRPVPDDLRPPPPPRT